MELSTLTNFNVPITTRKRFDVICHASGRTRTSVLVELMTNYVLEEGKLPPTNDILDHLEKQNQVMALMAQIQKLPPEAQPMAMQQIMQAMTEFTQQVQLAQMIPDMGGIQSGQKADSL
jgi:hypothetical protein